MGNGNGNGNRPHLATSTGLCYDMISLNLPAASAGRSQGWAFPDSHATRDPRLDLLRGLVFVLLFAVHFDVFSVFTYLSWERIGVVSSAETFVALAGIVVGIVFGRKMRADGLRACVRPMLARAWDLYKANLLVILLVGALRYLPGLDMDSVTTFSDPYTGAIYPLYPLLSEGAFKLVLDAALLRCGPHQFQVIGLYVVLFLLSPLVLYCIDRRKTRWLSAASFALYAYNFFLPETVSGTAEIRLTGAQFEYAFPLAAWQLLYVHAVIAGVFKEQIVEFLSRPSSRWLVWLSATLTLGFMVFTLNHPMDKFPEWTRLHLIGSAQFLDLYGRFFLKHNLGPGRLLNEVVLFISLFALLTVCWRPIERALGWFFIPLGRASLYVFTVHIFLVLLVDNLPLGHSENFVLNSLLHAGLLVAVWWCVKKEWLFRWVPH
jgi:hypothetical protein